MHPKFEQRLANLDKAAAPKQGDLDNGGGPPHDNDMEARLSKLETKFETILPTLSTKSDLGEVRSDIHKVDSSIKTWMLATMLTIIGTMLAAIFGINQIYKSSQPAIQASQPQPIVIQIPPAPTAQRNSP